MKTAYPLLQVSLVLQVMLLLLLLLSDSFVLQLLHAQQLLHQAALGGRVRLAIGGHISNQILDEVGHGAVADGGGGRVQLGAVYAYGTYRGASSDLHPATIERSLNIN